MFNNIELDDVNEEGNDEEDNVLDWQLPVCFMKKRHKEKIEGTPASPQTWKMKEKVFFKLILNQLKKELIQCVKVDLYVSISYI